MTTETLTLRRKTAIQQLEKQLELGTKPNKALKAPVGMTRTAFKKANPRLPLTKKDERRIRNTIEILHTKIRFNQ